MRANKALRTLRTYLGRTIRDITRQIAGEGCRISFARACTSSAGRRNKKEQDENKVYSLHAPEVECIGKSLPSGLTRGERPTLLTSSA
jgi:IS5 family transposase